MTALRLLSYNILRGGKRGTPLHEVVREIAPDVLLVNECPRGLFTWRRRCQALADRWGIRFVDGGRPAGSNMLCVSAALTVKASGCERLHRDPFRPFRGIVWAQLRVGGQLVGVVGCHLSLHRADRVRQVEHVLAAAGRLRGPVVVLGDLNEPPQGPCWQRLRQAGYVDSGSDEWLTFPAEAPVKRIDALLVRGQARVEWVGDPGVPVDLLAAASDHRPVLGVLEV